MAHNSHHWVVTCMLAQLFIIHLTQQKTLTVVLVVSAIIYHTLESMGKPCRYMQLIKTCFLLQVYISGTHATPGLMTKSLSP